MNWRRCLVALVILVLAGCVSSSGGSGQGTLYEDLGPDYFDKRGKGKHVHRLINRLQNLGFAVQITPVEAVA